MLRKEHLPTRLGSALLEKLRRAAAAKNISISDMIALALDALEHEETVTERMEKMEKGIASLTEIMAHLDHKMDEASINEKERMRSLLQLLERKIEAHDQAEQARFDRIAPRVF